MRSEMLCDELDQSTGREEVFVYETEKAIVRIHFGNLTREELQKLVEEAAKDFYKAICRQGKAHLIENSKADCD